MPALKPTDFTARIAFIGRVTDRDASLRSDALARADLTFAGIDGETHAGVTRPSCSRVKSQHPKGTEIRNVRQLSIVSVEELAETQAAMGLKDPLEPIWIGASLVIEGIPDFSHVPPSSRLQAPSGATLIVDMQNRPCHLPAREIDKDQPGFGAKYKVAAQGRRGVTASVERPGSIAVGDLLRLHVPDQRLWTHLEAARASA